LVAQIIDAGEPAPGGMFHFILVFFLCLIQWLIKGFK
jgi:hypothetical protein